jgi:hypothetical protein
MHEDAVLPRSAPERLAQQIQMAEDPHRAQDIRIATAGESIEVASTYGRCTVSQPRKIAAAAQRTW